MTCPFLLNFVKHRGQSYCKGEGNVIHRFLPHGIEIVHDVYIVFKSWQGAQGQGPAIDLVLCVSVIRVDTNGYDAKLSTIYFGTPCKYALNKIPQLAMGL